MKMRTAIVLAVVVGIAILAILIAARRTQGPQQVLADGTRLTLVTVKAGHRHESPLATFRERLAARLPASWNQRLKIQPPAATRCEYSGSNYLSVWLTAENCSSAPKFRLLIGDERDNFTINAEHHGRSVSVSLSSNAWLIGLPVAAWPRRAETIRIQVYPKHDSKLLGEFRVKNPGRDLKTPPWTASAWPITVRDGDLDFTLTSLWVGLGSSYRDWKLRAEKDPIQRWTRASFRVTRQGEAQTNWIAHHVRAICDATGNWSDGNGFISIIREGETMNHFSRPPLPADEAWRLTVEFSRLSGFSTEELHAVSRVSVPGPGQSWRTATNSLGPDRLEFAWETRPSEGTNAVGVWITVQPIRSDHKLTLVRATDDRGREVPFRNSGGGASVTHEELTFAPDAAWVDCVFAYHRSRVVTFQVKPEFYRPAGN